MNKSELVKALAEKAGVSQTDCGRVINALIDVIGESIAKNETVSIAQFGTFSQKERSARTGRNPQTGATIQIAAKKYAHFKPYSALNEKL